MKKTFLTVLLALLCFGTMSSQNVTKKWLTENYRKAEVMVPMRDGISLYTSIYTPAGISEKNPRPIIIHRTPYGCKPYGTNEYRLMKELKNYYLHDYIIVMQDVRGRYMSEGEFINMEERPEDTWDTVEWLLQHIRGHNGKVGITGCSYPGYYALMGALARHPAIKAVAPQAPILDWYMGDDAHHNGVLMLLDTYSFGRNFYRPCPNPTKTMPPVKNMIDKPVYDFFLEKMTFENITETFPEPLFFWNTLGEHPDYDDYWKVKTPARDLKRIKAAMLIVGGTYDTDDCYGALNTYRTIRKQSPRTDVHLVYGPWYHGSWRQEDSYLDEIEYPFFSRYLDNGTTSLPEVMIIPSQHSRGDYPSPVQTSDGKIILRQKALPDKNAGKLEYYLHRKNILSAEQPEKTCGHDAKSCYTSDPFHPVPSDNRSKRDRRYMIADQRFVAGREDVLNFSTAPATDTLKLVGPVDVRLYATCSNEDADFIVKVTDVAPDGYQMLVRWDVMRGRYRHSFTKPEPMTPDKVSEISFRMSDIAHYILPGHRLAIQIQSSFFPATDLNPGTYVQNIYKAKKSDFRKSEICIFHNSDFPSSITFHIIHN